MTTNQTPYIARASAGEQIHYIRLLVNWNDVGIATGKSHAFALPHRCIVFPSVVQVITPFNAATTNVVTAGFNASSYDNLVTGAQTLAGAAGLKSNLLPTGTALLPLVGDQVLYTTYTQTGTAATAGQLYIIICYIPYHGPI